MKTPTWGTAIGVMMIVFGGCSVLNDLRAITLPDKLEEQRAKLQHKMKESKTVEIDSLATQHLDSLTTATESDPKESGKEKGLKFAEKIFDLSEFTKTWIVRFGYIGVFVSIIYMLGGIFLLMPKRFSIRLAYSALILSIACSGVQAVVLTSSGSSSGFIALATGASQLLGIIVDIILLSIIFASDKDAYTSVQ